MAYVLSQFVHPAETKSGDRLKDNSDDMTLLTSGTTRRRQSTTDEGVLGNILDPFYDECLQMAEPFTMGASYYFHSKIKRLNTPQTFYIYLVNYNDLTNSSAQFLKTITVQGGDSTEWVDLELIFTPLKNFDTILFKLRREAEDYSSEVRYPVLVYQEVSLLNNIITNSIGRNVSLSRFGLQGHPGMVFCLNGEEIHIGRSGVYELRTDLIKVSFLSIVTAAEEDEVDLEFLLQELSEQNAAQSISLLGNAKTRSSRPYILDYVYNE